MTFTVKPITLTPHYCAQDYEPDHPADWEVGAEGWSDQWFEPVYVCSNHLADVLELNLAEAPRAWVSST